MLQVIQPIDGRATEVAEVPAPACGPGQVLVANACSLISAGTEKAVVALARKSLLAKARERPDQVRRVLQKVRQEGLAGTLRQVRAKLDQPMPLGYSSAGVVLAVGAGVDGLRPGDRVASNGPHAGIVAVGRNLVARVPDGVEFDRACYAVVGSIALQGVRLAGVGLGSVVGVIGLGLIGQLAVALLRASGCRVVGADPDPARCALATEFGAEWAGPSGLAAAVAGRSGGHGADAVLICASTASDAPLALAAKVARAKARVVAVGAIGLNVPRRDFYPKELELVVSCSYGPGRYDRRHEEGGLDYPYAHVRWTEGRNIQAVLDLMAAGSLDVGRLTTHRFPVERAVEAYDLIRSGAEPALGVVLTYPEAPAEPARRVALPPLEPAREPMPAGTAVGVGFVGAGNFASAVLLPALGGQGGVAPVGLCSAGGLSARNQARRHGFRYACTDHRELLADPAVDCVFIATRHDLHASMLLDALRAGKAAFVEKPLAIRPDELDEIEAFLAAGGPIPPWTVGFNRRFAPATLAARDHFRGVAGPLTAIYRFNAGELPADHWAHDEAVGGGRIVGEACHAIDLLTYLQGGPVTRVHAEAVEAAGPVDRCVITLRHEGGGVSTLLYDSGGDRSSGKERLEIFGGGRSAAVDDFSSVELAADGRRTRRRWRGQDKGHRAEVAAFLGAVRAGGPGPIPADELLATARAALGAIESLRTGQPIEVSR